MKGKRMDSLIAIVTGLGQVSLRVRWIRLGPGYMAVLR